MRSTETAVAVRGFALERQGLADLAGTNMQEGITAAVRDGTMSASEAFAARGLARMFGSAVRALGNPDDPSYAFASAFVGDVVQDVLPPIEPITHPPAPLTPAFDDDGNLMPGIVDPSAPLAERVAQLTAALQAQGYSSDDAARLALRQLVPPSDPFAVISDDDDTPRSDALADALGVPPGDIVDAGWTDDALRSVEALQGFAEGVGFSLLSTGEAVLDVLRSPRQFINGVKLLLNSAEARAQFGEDLVNRVRIDVQMMEDAFASGDLRGTAQQLGKLTGDLAQVAGGVEAVARLGVSATTAGGRLVLRTMDDLAEAALRRTPSLFDAAGQPLMDFRTLTTAQKQIIGETMGPEAVQRLVPDAQRIGRAPTVGQQGIDDLYKVSRPDVDFVVVEYKFGSGTLGATADGRQMSDSWLLGSERLRDSVGRDAALDVRRAVDAGRIEKWLVHTDPFGNVTVGLIDSNGKIIPKPRSLILGGH